jgi:hypothetical protein
MLRQVPVASMWCCQSTSDCAKPRVNDRKSRRPTIAFALAHLVCSVRYDRNIYSYEGTNRFKITVSRVLVYPDAKAIDRWYWEVSD